jgi:hypothetical protein
MKVPTAKPQGLRSLFWIAASLVADPEQVDERACLALDLSFLHCCRRAWSNEGLGGFQINRQVLTEIARSVAAHVFGPVDSLALFRDLPRQRHITIVALSYGFDSRPDPRDAELRTKTNGQPATMVAVPREPSPVRRVRVEFQFRQELGSEISRCNVAARYMTQV